MTRTTRLNASYEPWNTAQPHVIFNELLQALEDGLLIRWSGAWSAGTYYIGDMVSHTSNLYICNTDTTDEPSLPTAGTDWSLLATLGPTEIDGIGFTAIVDAVNTWVTRIMIGAVGRITVDNGDGVATDAIFGLNNGDNWAWNDGDDIGLAEGSGDPYFDLALLADSGVGSLLAITRDAWGRVSGTRATTYADFPNPAYTAITTTYTALTTDYTINATSGTFDLTLPTAVGAVGKVYNLKNSGTGVVTILTTASQTVDDQASSDIQLTQYENLQVQSDGANWIIL